jgi:hypothetical protein
MDMNIFRRRPGTSVRRIAVQAVAGLGLSLLGFGGAAHADDVTVQPAPGSGLVVTDNTGASPRFKVLESGPIFLGGLVGSPPTQNQGLCYDTTTGRVGPCPSAKNLAFCVPNATASPRYVDNMDGTVTDLQTCLMWEKKTGTVGDLVDCLATCTDRHDVNNVYRWSAGVGQAPDGDLFTDFLAWVNGQECAVGSPCPSLGGHSDWRVPTLSELQTIVDVSATGCGMGSPCINSAFGPTRADLSYLTTSFPPGRTDLGWRLSFFGGNHMNDDHLNAGYLVRAVRGGS